MEDYLELGCCSKLMMSRRGPGNCFLGVNDEAR